MFNHKNQNRRVIAYVPPPPNAVLEGEVIGNGNGSPAYNYYRQQTQSAPEMRTLGRWLWFYTHKFGLDFGLVLVLALGYQCFMSVFIGLNGIVTLHIFDGLLNKSANPAGPIVGSILAVLVAGLVQGLIIAEMAQVVWLRRPDWLRVRLMSGSIWWWVMLVALVVTVTLNFLLLFLSITGQANLVAAWQAVTADQKSGLVILLLSILNVLTLLRCAASMRTSTNEENRRDVEEHVRAMADEVLLTAGEGVRKKAVSFYNSMGGGDPWQYVPITEAVIKLVSSQHPGIFPPELEGSSWAYNPTGNAFVSMPADMHLALLQNQGQSQGNIRNSGGGGNERARQMWQLEPPEQAESIDINLQRYGKPKFVLATEPGSPVFMGQPNVNMQALRENGGMQSQPHTSPSSSSHFPQLAAPTSNTSSQVSFNQSQGGNFNLAAIPSLEQALFANYLSNRVFPAIHGENFPVNANLNVFEMFDEVDLQWYYRFWKKNGSNAALPIMSSGGN